MPIVIPDLSGLSQGIESGTSALAQALEKKAERRMEQQGLDAVLGSLENIGGDVGILAKSLKEENVPAKYAFPFVQAAYAQHLKGQERKPTPFEKKVQEGTADVVVNTIQSIPGIQRARQNIGELRELGKDLRGPLGLAKAAVGSETANEYNARAMMLVEQPLKILNPKGPIPKAKIDLLKQMFVPTAGERRGVQEGKLKAAESFLNSAEEHAMKVQALYNEYGGDIPIAEMLKLEQEGQGIIDEALSKSGAAEAEDQTKVFDKLPSAAKYKGKTMYDDKGNRVKSNGTRWVKVQ